MEFRSDWAGLRALAGEHLPDVSHDEIGPQKDFRRALRRPTVTEGNAMRRRQQYCWYGIPVWVYMAVTFGLLALGAVYAALAALWQFLVWLIAG
jgi:hypothetical protein